MPRNIANLCEELCPYYYDVHEIFMDCASSFAAYTSERDFDEDSRSSESGTDTGTDSAITDGSNTSFLSLMGKSPLTSGGQ